MGYRIGLDLGVSSVGWAILRCGESGEVIGITPGEAGSLCFSSPIAELDKGRRVTNRTNRGSKRRQRHRLDHNSWRRKKLTGRLRDLDWWPTDAARCEMLQSRTMRELGGTPTPDHPIALKVRGLSEKLEQFELGKVLLHYQKHRGFLSTADLPALLGHARASGGRDDDGDEGDGESETKERKEAKKLNAQMESTVQAIKSAKLTVSQFQLAEIERGRAVRAVGGGTATPHRYRRWLYIEEFDRIWDVQSRFYPEMSEDLWKELRALVFYQLPLESKDKHVGFCEFLGPNQPPRDDRRTEPKGHRRARRGELVHQRSMILQALVNLRYWENGDEKRLTPEQIRLF